MVTCEQEDPRGYVAKVSDFGLSQLAPDKTPSAGAKMSVQAEDWSPRQGLGCRACLRIKHGRL